MQEFFIDILQNTQTLLNIAHELIDNDVQNKTLQNQTSKYIKMPKLSFTMGSDFHNDEKPKHQITINYDFAISKHLVTVKEYMYFAQSTNSNYPEWAIKKDFKNINLNNDAPIVGVSWENAKAYCKWLSLTQNKAFRLPTEAEWEFACKANASTKYYFGDNEFELNKYAWYAQNSNKSAHPVGIKKPNAWGLYDMHGNVWEWCEDVWMSNYDKTPRDGSANKIGNQRIRVLRGGSWADSARYVRCCNRNGYDFDSCDNDIGFRIVLDEKESLKGVL